MSDQQIATSEPRSPKRSGPLTTRIKHAIELMVWHGKPYADAAKEVGITTRAMRLALEKPPVLQFMRAQQQVLRASEGPRSILRLAEIRDHAPNMPAVQACRDLLAEQSDISMRSITSQQQPGVVVHIHAAPSSASLTAHERQIEAKPLISLDCGHTDPVRPGDPNEEGPA